MAEKQVELITRGFVKALRSRNTRVEKATLFGSYATGQATQDSDIDIAIISPYFGNDCVEEAVMLKRVSEDIDLDISPRPYSLDEYRKASRGEFLYDEILRRGRPIDA
ncbi:MAG: nucleotidyltransferase domain-containing protein [Firmicutes bacterium]|jgi:predicted nucleotidyltransferase|nr:nucleotidyltransferase domain-containing protein [Bacillota bacterium]MDH7496258.1 nucleotidyltransferase domain-containing protein [Bacillota bacterium]